MCVYMHVYVYACLHACMHVCMCVCMYACMHVCMYYVFTFMDSSHYECSIAKLSTGMSSVGHWDDSQPFIYFL